MNGFEFEVSFAQPSPLDTNNPDGSGRETREILKRILRRIDGLTFGDGSRIDPAQADHVDRLPWSLQAAIYEAIIESITPKKPS